MAQGFNFSMSYSFEREDGEEVEVYVAAKVAPYIPAYISGPPENCYPAEGGDCEDYEIRLDGREITDAEFEAMGGDLSDLIEKVEVAAGEQEPDEPDYDPREDDRDDYRSDDFDDSSRDP